MSSMSGGGRVKSTTGNINLTGGSNAGRGTKIAGMGFTGLVPSRRGGSGKPFNAGAHFVKPSPQPRG